MFFPGLFGNTSQMPTNGGNPASWLVSALGGGNRSTTGIHITPESALGFVSVFACVRLLSESIAQLPCNLYRRTDDKGNREQANDHPVHDLISAAPNGWQTAFQYHEFQQAGLGLRGNAYAYVERDGSGTVSNIIPLNPALVNVRVGANRQPVYDLLGNGENELGVPFSKIHHIAAFSTNGYLGMSPIQAGRDALGLAMATEQHASLVFANGTQIGGVLERPYIQGAKQLSEDSVKALKKQWSELYSGLKNTGEVAVLQDGIQFKSISMSNEDAQLLASRAHGINEVARLYNVPPHMIQMLERSTNNNIEHQALQFVMYTLMPWVRRHETAQMRDLLTAKERKNLYIEFNVAGLMRGDLQTRFASYAQGRQWGWLSVNDIRRMENLPPVRGGDVYLQPLNMVDAGSNPLKNAKLARELDEIKAQTE